jgi:hypothetical protein
MKLLACEINTNHSMAEHLIESLNFNENGIGKDKCVICAYNNGLKDGEKKLLDFATDTEIETCIHGRKALKISIENIHENQNLGSGRHKCAICAYHLGYEIGMGDQVNDFDEFGEDELVDQTSIYDITTFGTSADVNTIYNRLKKGKYYIPSFQRDYVWKIPQASRLIESIVMGLPIPSIFIAKDEDENYYVIDGQQRLKSIEKFYDNDFALKDVIDEIRGKKYRDLDEKIQNRIDEYAIQLIVIKQEKPDDNNDSIYKIFERINTEGTKLYPQEIRASSYHGEFNELLHEFAQDHRWIKFIATKNNRKTHEELILRFISLYFYMENYKAPMKHFLNVYMGKNRHFNHTSKTEIMNIFDKTFEICNQYLNKEHICLKGSNRINTQLLDSILVGIAKNIENPDLYKNDYLVNKINLLKDLIDDEKYEFKKYWESRMSSDDYVKGRCKITIELFGKH